MCDISVKTNFKQKTVYKVAFQSKRGKLYSIFTYLPLVVGPVKDDRYKMMDYCRRILGETHDALRTNTNLYNPNMLGKVSGFAKKGDAITLAHNTGELSHVSRARLSGKVVVLKIVLGGEILQGTTENVTHLISYYNLTYAGSVIKSIEKLQA